MNGSNYIFCSVAKYKLPPTCFIPGSKQSAITQVIEAISDNRLEMPEMCGLYTSDEVKIKYIICFMAHALHFLLQERHSHQSPTDLLILFDLLLLEKISDVFYKLYCSVEFIKIKYNILFILSKPLNHYYSHL